MSRGLFLAWLQWQRIDPAAVPKLTFETPISRYTLDAELAWRERIDQSHRQQDEHWHAERMRWAIWAMAGMAFTRNRRLSRSVRGEAGTCLALLRRAWAAHAVGRRDLARAEFAGAREAWLSASREDMEREAFAARKRQHDAVTFGMRGGRPPSEWDDDWLKMFEDRQARNPALSKSSICKMIAAVWSDEEGRPRSARTIEAGVTRAQKVRSKPPFSRKA